MLGPYEQANHKRAEARTETFLSSVIPVVVQLVGRLELKMVAGMVSLCSERWEVAKVLATRVREYALDSSAYRLTGSLVFTARRRTVYHPILPSRDAQAYRCSSCTGRTTRTHGAIASRAGSVVSRSFCPAEYTGSDHRFAHRNLASANLLRNLIPKLPSVFPSTQAQAAAFGPGIYLLGGNGQNAASEIGSKDEKEGMQMDLKDGEVWGLIASFGLQAPPDEQTLLVSSLRDKVSWRWSAMGDNRR